MLIPSYTDTRVDCFHDVNNVSLFIRVYGDLQHEISGNKSFKLLQFLKEAKPNQTLVSFGGAWSNHLLALSSAAKALNRKSVGIIRGEEPLLYSPYLKAMKANGMYLHFISRDDYRNKESDDVLQAIKLGFPDSYIIPEGGAGIKGILGAADMVKEVEEYDVVVLPGATGTTLAGIASKLKNSKVKIICFQVLKGENIINNELQRTSGIDLDIFNQVEVIEQFHFGGYAKKSQELIEFQQMWNDKTGIPLDLVYGAKAMFGLFQLINSGQIPQGSKVLYLHTGGLGPINLAPGD